MYNKILLLLFLPFLLIACSEEEPKNGLFEIFVSEAPRGTESSVNDTDCGISTSGESQTIKISLVGDYDSIEITENTAEWIEVTAGSSTITLSLSEFRGGEDDVRNAAVCFTVFKGNNSVFGRIIVHQYPLLDCQDNLQQPNLFED